LLALAHLCGGASLLKTEHLPDDVPQGLRVLAHARVPRDDGHELRGFTKEFGRGQVHRVERADGFERKRAADTSENGPVDVEDEATPVGACDGTRPTAPLVAVDDKKPASIRIHVHAALPTDDFTPIDLRDRQDSALDVTKHLKRLSRFATRLRSVLRVAGKPEDADVVVM
jgi:hypothetical protein